MSRVPNLRNPLQVALHKGLNYINLVSITEVQKLSGIEKTVVIQLSKVTKGVDLDSKIVFIKFRAILCTVYS